MLEPACLVAAIERLAAWDAPRADRRKAAAPWLVHHLLDATAGRRELACDCVEGVEGALLFKNVLTKEECGRIITASEQIGFGSGEDCVSVPQSVRRNDAVAFVVDDDVRRELSLRLSAALPRQGCGNATLATVPVNGLWRCYRYEEPTLQDQQSGTEQRFMRHFDGSQLETQGTDGMTSDATDRATGKPLCQSQMSLLVYLNDGFHGGETKFYNECFKPGRDDVDTAPDSDLWKNAVQLAAVSPSAGSVLVFWHGHHPLSPLHEGAALKPAPSPKPPAGGEGARCKYVVRTDVLYQLPLQVASDSEWSSNSYVQAMMWAATRVE